MMKSIIGGLLAAAVSGMAGAQSFDRILDLPFGEPLDRRFLTCRDADHDTADYCAASSPYIRPAGAMKLDLLPPENTTRPIPTWVKRVLVKLDELANVTQVLIWTPGVGAQQKVLAAITERFGAAQKSTVREVATLTGAKASVIRSEWILPGGFVYHNCSRIDECTVWVMTPKAYERFLQEDERLQQRNKF